MEVTEGDNQQDKVQEKIDKIMDDREAAET